MITWTAHLESYRHDDYPTLVIRTQADNRGSRVTGFYLDRAGMWQAIGSMEALASIGIRIFMGEDDLHRRCYKPECDDCWTWRELK